VKKRSDTGKWEVRWRENGRNRSRSFSMKADAERFELGVRRAREMGGQLDLDRGQETVAEFMERWWLDYAVPTLADNTRDCYARIWERHVRRRLAGYRMRDVTPAVVAGLKADLTKEGVGAATVHKALAIVSGMFRQAVIWDRVDRNPVREIKLPRATRKRFVPPVAPVMVEAMRARLLEKEQLRDATLVSVLAYAGLRPEEARALRWEDVGERTIRVERAAAGSTVKETKTDEIRTVRLLVPLARDLAMWREQCGGRQVGWCSRRRAGRSGRTSIGATGGSVSIGRLQWAWGSRGAVPTTFVTRLRPC
jgi:integrase